jgi:hypothetical protein
MPVIGLAACREPARLAGGEPTRTAVVRRGDIVDRQLLTGELRAASSIGLTVPRTDSWQLQIRWLADDGARVLAGDKVVELDNSAFTAQLEEKHLAVLEAEMTLRGARDLGEIAIAGKETELRQHQIALDKATVHASVPADLLAGRDAQERQLEKRRAEVAVDKATHDLTTQRDETALELKLKQIELDKARRAVAAAEKTITDLVLTAPRDGILVLEDHPWLGRKIRADDTVISGMAVASLPDLNQPMEVRAELSDVDDGRVAVGMSGTCALDAYPSDPMPCTIKDVTPVARSKNETSLRRAFAVVLDLGKSKPDPARMRPGMSVKVELHPHVLAGAVVVPRGAIDPTGVAPRPAELGGPGQRSRVRMATGELRDVTLGPCDAQACAVLTGIAAGDLVVVDAPGLAPTGGST